MLQIVVQKKTAEVSVNKEIADEVFKNIISEEGYEVTDIK